MSENNWIELYRAFVPRNRILSDNFGQHYRSNQGKMNFLAAQFEAFKNDSNEYNSLIGDFHYKDLQRIQDTIGEDPIKIRCEVWRANNIRFDPQNYSKIFKMPIDKLTKLGFMSVDDNWNFVSSVSYAGGGANAWDRSYNYRNVNKDDTPIYTSEKYSLMADGLPKDMTIDWWNKYSQDLGDVFIRILVTKE